MLKLIHLALFAVALTFGFGIAAKCIAADPAPATQPADTKPCNTKCPVAGDEIDPAITTVYNGKTYAFCFQSCVKKFTDNPEKYIANVK